MFLEPPFTSQILAGRAPFAIGLINVLAVRLDNGGNRGGRFVMTEKWKIRNALKDAKCRVNDRDLRRSGIYRIVNKINGHCYVGQSKNLLHRKTSHFKDLSNGRHSNPYLQNAYCYYGGANFYFDVIEFVCKYDELDMREQYWIERLNPEYNIVRNVFAGIASRDTDRINRTSGERYIKDGETFDRPIWHKWVYGGCRKRYE